MNSFLNEQFYSSTSIAKNIVNRLTIILIIFVYSSIESPIYSQLNTPNSSEKNYTEILQQYEAYLANIPEDSANELTQQIEQFNYFWKGRVSDESFSNPGLMSEYFKTLSQNASNLCNTNNYNPEPWTLIGPYNSEGDGIGSVSTIWSSVNNNTIFAGTRSSGLWKSSNGGQDWSNVFDYYYFTGTGVEDISVHPTNEDEIYVATSYYGGITSAYGAGLLRSLDGGDTWSNISGLELLITSALGYDPFTLPIVSVEIDPSTPFSVYAGSRNLLFKGENNGVTWSNDTPFLTNQNDVIFQEIEYSPFTGSIFASTISEDGISNEAELFKKSNGSSAWLNLTSNFQVSTDEIVEIELDILPNGNIYAKVVYAQPTPYMRIFKSSNDGSSFNLLDITLNGSTGTIPLPTTYNGFEIIEEGIGSELPKFYIGLGKLNFFNNTEFLSNSFTLVNDIFHAQSDEYIYIANRDGISKVEIYSINEQSLNNLTFPLGEYFSVGVSEKDANIISTGSINHGSFSLLKNGWKAFLPLHTGGNSVIEISNPTINYCINNNDHYRIYYDYNSEEFVWDYLGFLSGHYLDQPIENNPTISGEVFIGTKEGFYKKSSLNIIPNPGSIPFTTLLTSTDDFGNSQVNGSFHSFDISEPSESNVTRIYVSSGEPTLGDVSKENFAVRVSTDWGSTWNSTSFPQSNLFNRITSTTTHTDKFYENFVFLTHAGIPQYNNERRVSLSKDYGNTWLEWSKGLLRVPVNDIAVQKGNNMVYAATDVGVYFRDATDQDHGTGWRCFSDQLPNCIVTGIEVNNCSQELIISTWGRGIWRTKLLPVNDLVIDTDTEWNDDIDIYSNIIITNGAELKITSTINMAEDKTITVKPGSYLRINGGTITNACERLWGGILIEGNSSLNQVPYSNQGRVAISANSTISNAYIALRNHGLKPDGSPNWSTTGGFVKATGSHFINNKWDLKTLPYQTTWSNGNPRDDQTQFTSCEFTINDDYNGTNLPPRIVLYKVYNVRFNNCSFSDNRSELESFEKGDGLYTLDASFTVKNYDPETITNTIFKNLRYGIQSWGIDNPLSSINIEGMDFECYRGVYFNGVENAKINKNNFDVDIYNEQDANAENMSYGVYLDMCKSYMVEENYLHSNLTDIPDPQGGSVGIVLHNLHKENTEIYNNEIEDFLVGIEAIGQNRNPDPASLEGLELLCNRFYDNSYSQVAYRANIFITENPNDPNEIIGISKNQGEFQSAPTAPAGNLFGINSSVNFVEYNNEQGTTINYFHHATGSYPNIVPSTINVNLINVGNSLYTIEEQTCPSSFANPREEEELLVLKTTSLNEIETNTSELELLVDGGSTSQLQSEVVSATNQTAYNNYIDLMQHAGFISEDVLKELSAQENSFSQGMIRNVLVANPHSAKSTDVQDNLDSRSNQLPQYMRDQIDQGLSHLSSKEFLELSIAQSKRKMDKAISEAYNIYSGDTINDRSADIVALYSNTGDINFDYKLVEFYDDTDNEVLADALLEVIDSNGLSSDEQNYHNNFINYRTLLKNWTIADKDLSALDSIDIATLIEYSFLSNTISSKAMTLLKLNGQLDYNEPLNMPTAGEKSNTNVEKSENKMNEFFTVYPNPAKQYITVDYNINGFESNASLIIRNSTGKEVINVSLINARNQEIVDVSSLSSGHYTCTFYVDKEIQETQKLIISK